MSIRNPKYRDSDMTAYSSIPEDYQLLVPCGTCVECRKGERSSWNVRLLLEIEHWVRLGKPVYFCTFTLAPERYEEFKADIHRPVRLYLENYRRVVGKSVKHFIVSELGDQTHRLHYHGFLFGPSLCVERLKSLWIYGFTNFQLANCENVNYVTKYILKPQLEEAWYKPKRFISPGLGRCYVDRYPCLDGNPNHLVKVNGFAYRLPRYLRQKMYTESYLRSLKYDLRRKDVTPAEFYGGLKLAGVTYGSVDELLTARKYRLEDSVQRKMSKPSSKPKNYIAGLALDVEAFDDIVSF